MSKKLFNPKIALVLVLIVVVIIAVLSTGNSNTPKPGKLLSDEERQELKDEFADAFPTDLDPTGEVVEYPIVAKPASITLPTGEIINSWTYGGTTPGPEIRLSLGDTLRIPFTNNLPDETTIHFHGIRVPNAMDGVPGVTQDPVQPGESFVYEFTPKDAGTFWFHPHVRGSEQLERGLYGTIIVEDEYTASLDQDHVLVIDDWRLSSETTIAENFNNMHDISHDGRWGNVMTVNSKAYEEVVAQSGERIRLRLVNAANGRVFLPEFSHPVELVAVDGMSLEKPIPYESLEISPGNRIDVELTIPQGVEIISVVDTFLNNQYTLAQIKVQGDSVASNTLPYPDTISIPTWSNNSLIQAQPDITYTLDAGGVGMGGMHGGGMMAFNWTINDDLYGEDTPHTLNADLVSKVRFQNDSLRFHPMHLHGQFFRVIARNGEAVDEPY